MNKKPHDSVSKLWNSFVVKHPKFKNVTIPESYYFCDNKKDANECAKLVVEGTKRATTSSMWWYETNQHPIAKVGDLAIITDWKGIAMAIIEIIKIDHTPFNKITAKYAKIEGEGDKSLAYWNRVHWSYYSREMHKKGQHPTKDMMLVCEQFQAIFIKK